MVGSKEPITMNITKEGSDTQRPNQTMREKPSWNFSLETPSPSSGTLEKYIRSVLGNDSCSAIPDILRAPDSISATELNKPEVMVCEPAPPIQPLQPILPMVHDRNASMLSNSLAQTMTTLATTDTNNEIIPIPRGQSYVDITEYLNMPQADAAKKLGIPPSTLSKRWKEAVRKRKWPYRMICKIDKEIMTLLHNVPQGPNAPPLPEEIESALGLLLRKRQEELRAVVIRI